MVRFFVNPGRIGGNVIDLDEADVRHVRSVLRMRVGDEVALCTRDEADETEYLCRLSEIGADGVKAEILARRPCRAELPAKLYLFQGLPKGDKMETIIQKSVELGVRGIVPVVTARTIVKLDPRKAPERVRRWQAIAEGAAKQSLRGLVPEVSEVLSWKDALKRAAGMDHFLIPYEKAEDIGRTRELLALVKAGESAAIFIGPEGGFEEAEIEAACQAGAKPLTLGHRILRTETAGPAILSALMLQLES